MRGVRGLLLCAAALVAAFALGMSVGATQIAPEQVLAALIRFDPDNFDHYAVLYQRLPRALIAIYVGAVMAMSGAVLQGITGNPLAAPSTLGITSGAALFVLLAVYLFDLPPLPQGVAALVGGSFGFLLALGIARLVGLSRDPRGLSLILSGALVSILLAGMSNALLLSDPARRAEYLSWLSGNINHVYIDRLTAFWSIGVLAMGVLLSQARALTLMTLGAEKAASAGVAVARVRALTLGAAMVGASSAVAICGPVAFVGLVVPHMVRAVAGGGFGRTLPANAMVGAALCLLADLAARRLFLPYTLNTGVLLDLLGGVVFAVVVKTTYLSSRHAGAGT